MDNLIEHSRKQDQTDEVDAISYTEYSLENLPRQLPCGHSFSESTIINIIKTSSKEPSCPNCRQSFDPFKEIPLDKMIFQVLIFKILMTTATETITKAEGRIIKHIIQAGGKETDKFAGGYCSEQDEYINYIEWDAEEELVYLKFFSNKNKREISKIGQQKHLNTTTVQIPQYINQITFHTSLYGPCKVINSITFHGRNGEVVKIGKSKPSRDERFDVDGLSLTEWEGTCGDRIDTLKLTLIRLTQKKPRLVVLYDPTRKFWVKLTENRFFFTTKDKDPNHEKWYLIAENPHGIWDDYGRFHLEHGYLERVNDKRWIEMQNHKLHAEFELAIYEE
jgi:hypothetical protein